MFIAVFSSAMHAKESVLGAGSLRADQRVKVEALPSLEQFYIEHMCSPGGGTPCVVTGRCLAAGAVSVC